MSFELTREAWAYFDDATCQWVAKAGIFDVLVGALSRDIRATAQVKLAETVHWAV